MFIKTDEGRKIENIDVVDSFLGRFKGLMFQESGRLLMEFQVKDTYGVWMPFMRFSIDIAFIRDGEVIEIFENVSPIRINPSTWKIYRPDKMCNKVLEVESGLLKKKNISEGSKVFLED